MPTLGEVVLGAFDLATEFARKRVRKELGVVDDPRVTREDFERAVIALQFDLMGVELAQAELAKSLHQHAMAHIRGRVEAERAAGDVSEVTVVEPTGDEPTTKPFAHLKLSDDEK